jgi:hypothetical protein
MTWDLKDREESLSERRKERLCYENDDLPGQSVSGRSVVS